MPPSFIKRELENSIEAKIFEVSDMIRDKITILNEYTGQWATQAEIVSELIDMNKKFPMRENSIYSTYDIVPYNDVVDDTFHLSLDDIEKQNFKIQEK